MSEREWAASGPHRIYVESTPVGATLDVEAFMTSAVQDVLELLLSPEFFDRFEELAEAQPSDPHTVRLPSELHMESLVADLVAAGPTRMALDGGQVLRLAEVLQRVAQPRPVPGQRREGGAAA
ncbi:hypothetical protein [Streptomyces sp. B15]|uniref:hypothetical protein n=1 Tax=Streptomyces sp. B15 TaxID=1537797 RepID=UPI001B38DC5F|nr:hypothetical protein [Streptomyces sp. B15]MBQ1122588.1 hypothetical protein [Streptomyces sp. B15]